MSGRRKLILGLVAATIGAIAIAGAWFYSMRPLTEKEIFAAPHLDFVQEMPIPDGGSYVFHFRLPHKRSVAIQVVHRHSELGGNPQFQEIRLDRLGAMNPYIDLRQGSALEAKLLSLLQSASIDTNAVAPYDQFTLPRQERLQWLIDRIQDRNSKW